MRILCATTYAHARRAWARCLARCLGADADHLWHGVDLIVPGQSWEATLTRRLGPWRVVLALGQLMLATVLIATTWWWLPSLASAAGAWWPIYALGAGWLMHGAFILVAHDAAHGNLFGPGVDRWVGAVATGALLLPFAAGTYVDLHRTHHARANGAGDNNWTPLRDRLYRRSRLLYVAYELLPVISNVDRIGASSCKDRAAAGVAWATAAGIGWWAAPGWAWYAVALSGLTIANAARLWVEHMGEDESATQASTPAVANTYGGCVFGFGIGHHDLHHRAPWIPAPILTIGLWLRPHQAHVATGWWRLLTCPGWRHFSTRAAPGASS